MRKNKKICLCSSSGGHFEQLMMLKSLAEEYDCFVVTEKLDYDVKAGKLPVKYVMAINRTDRMFFFKFLYNIFKSFFIVAKEHPNFIISMGALATVPMMFWTKVFGGKVIYIESFAKINTPNKSGRIAYKFADQFYIQWESLRKYYPNAINKGGIY